MLRVFSTTVSKYFLQLCIVHRIFFVFFRVGVLFLTSCVQIFSILFFQASRLELPELSAVDRSMGGLDAPPHCDVRFVLFGALHHTVHGGILRLPHRSDLHQRGDHETAAHRRCKWSRKGERIGSFQVLKRDGCWNSVCAFTAGELFDPPTKSLNLNLNFVFSNDAEWYHVKFFRMLRRIAWTVEKKTFGIPELFCSPF